MNSLTYAAQIANEYNRSSSAYYNLVAKVLENNDHSTAQPGTSAIALSSFQAMPQAWQDWVWNWDESNLDPENPALLHIARQMTFRNDFMQDYHSYRAFIHLAAAAALIEP